MLICKHTQSDKQTDTHSMQVTIYRSIYLTCERKCGVAEVKSLLIRLEFTTFVSLRDNSAPHSPGGSIIFNYKFHFVGVASDEQVKSSSPIWFSNTHTAICKSITVFINYGIYTVWNTVSMAVVSREVLGTIMCDFLLRKSLGMSLGHYSE